MKIGSHHLHQGWRLQQAALTGLAAFVLHDHSQLIKDQIPRGKQDMGVSTYWKPKNDKHMKRYGKLQD